MHYPKTIVVIIWLLHDLTCSYEVSETSKLMTLRTRCRGRDKQYSTHSLIFILISSWRDTSITSNSLKDPRKSIKNKQDFQMILIMK